MPAFTGEAGVALREAYGNTREPARTRLDFSINSPDGFPHDYPPGDLWWTGLHSDWQATVPPSVTRATSLLCNPLVRMPWVVTRPSGVVQRPWDEGYPAWLLDPQLLNGSSGGPNTGPFHMLDRADRFSVFTRWITSAMWTGVGLMTCKPDAAGQPTTGTVQNVSATRLYRGEDKKRPWGFEADGTVWPVEEDGTVHYVTEGEDGRPHMGVLRLMVLRHSLPGGVLGWHRAQLALAQSVRQYAADTFASDVPTGTLSTDMPLTQTQADAARTEWHTRQARRQIAVLGNGIRYVQAVASPLDMELVAMARLSNEQIAHAFELPAWYLDAGTNDFTYSNSRDWRQDLVDGPLASWRSRLEETVSALFPWGTRMTVDFTEYTTQTTAAPEVQGA